MTSLIESRSSQNGTDSHEVVPNTVALIGVVLAAVSVAFCALLFSMVDQMPDRIKDFQELETGTAAQLRLLILGCSTALLAFVAFVLCLIALILPGRPRVLASLGTCLSGCILLGVFATLLVGTWMNPVQQKPVQPDESASQPVIQSIQQPDKQTATPLNTKKPEPSAE